VPGLSSGTTLFQTKAPLSLIPGIKVTTSKEHPDIISLDDSNTCERALLPCGHAISSESMFSLIKNTIKGNNTKLLCCGYKCNKEIPLDLAEKIAVLSIKENHDLDQKLVDALFIND
jgi:hypothetical protein